MGRGVWVMAGSAALELLTLADREIVVVLVDVDEDLEKEKLPLVETVRLDCSDRREADL